MGSIAYKIALVAKGNCDVALSFTKKNDWDLAAADLLVSEAGGEIKTFDNKDIKYNLKESLLNPEFIAYSKYKFKI